MTKLIHVRAIPVPIASRRKASGLHFFTDFNTTGQATMECSCNHEHRQRYARQNTVLIDFNHKAPHSCIPEILCRMMSPLPRSKRWRHAVKRTARHMLGQERSCRTLLPYHSNQWSQKQQSSRPSSCMSSYSRTPAACLPCTAS